LRSVGKGANRTPPDCVAADLPQAGATGSSAEPLEPSPPAFGSEAGAGGRPAARVVERQDVKRVETVTVISMAEPMRRDFLSVRLISRKA
jgi:hypothetical protein